MYNNEIDKVSSIKPSKSSVVKVKKKSKSNYEITFLKNGQADITINTRYGASVKYKVTVK